MSVHDYTRKQKIKLRKYTKVPILKITKERSKYTVTRLAVIISQISGDEKQSTQ